MQGCSGARCTDRGGVQRKGTSCLATCCRGAGSSKRGPVLKREAREGHQRTGVSFTCCGVAEAAVASAAGEASTVFRPSSVSRALLSHFVARWATRTATLMGRRNPARSSSAVIRLYRGWG